MSKMKSIMVLFGGQSGEHEVSLESAQSVLNALDRTRYEVQTIGISKGGKWFWGVEPKDWKTSDVVSNDNPQVTLVHDPSDPRFVALDGKELPNQGKFDIIFPVLHGPFGEDGTIQGLFEMSNVPYVGSGVLGASLGMDKDRMKAVFAEAGLPMARTFTLLRTQYNDDSDQILNRIELEIGYPCFIKPANLGSSVGISKAYNREDLRKSIELAALYDRKLVIEENINGREIEVSVLGNESPQASVPGEILPANDFYDYEAKYHDTSSRLLIPAPLETETMNKLQKMAVKAFQAVEASGLSRVDFFLTSDQKIYVNEINTMPGFTQISMYPKLWEASGIPYLELIDRLISLGLERFKDLRNRRISR
ncbi:D-alanine--D-alanine ligase [Desulfitobacterium metallireducens]|uniref:D-alanine--D-alanine ligase n=1 Tax=Desulfitobacterium metallireducens DSM 15288 TaxID=871968 RepID=W0EBP5_9FIRM|nr:D-alanine--D-alanine ligase [Desulfitobacterium metallireducens]AHF06963.1 D-alanine--D-alanine ligase [Desulfitobacterium metallireducens DSM 15288]